MKTIGITLVALVVTIVVLIILATISINAVFGENGLIKESRKAKDFYKNRVMSEEEAMNRLLEEYNNAMENSIGGIENSTGPTNIPIESITLNMSTANIKTGEEITLIASVLPETATNKDVKWTSSDNSIATVTDEGEVRGIKAGITTITASATDGSGESAICEVTVKDKPLIDKTETKVGYYADVDGEGTVDGVIYADLAFTKSGQWYNGNGAYSYNKVENTKEYYISQENYAGRFGTKDVITAKEGAGADRFYVMALNDFSSSTYMWCSSGSMSGASTSVNFGTGKTNTAEMVSKWNGDMWNAIKGKVTEGWFVPSRGEWGAFADCFKITNSNYSSTYGLSYDYWSSSQDSTGSTWYASFSNGAMRINRVNYNYNVRLSATF